jgi:ribosome biogenesis GTPase
MRRRGRRNRSTPPDDAATRQARGVEVATGVVTARHHHRFVVRRDGRDDRAPLTVASRPGDPPLVVGDRVSLSIEEADGAFRLRERLDRRSALERIDPGDPRGEARLTLAANVDLLVLVEPLSRPRPGLVDRLAVAAAAAELDLLVCIHKTDLLHRGDDPDLHAAVTDITLRARAAGAAVVHTACPPGDGDVPLDVADLRAAIGDRVAVLIGPSGAGKSSLACTLVPGLELATGAVRDDDGKGRHTTSASGWFALPGGGALIDTPGVRAFGLGRPDLATLARAFPDVTTLGAGCRFRDCRHAGEPDCAVTAAVAAGQLSENRLTAWQRITAPDPAPG